MSSIRIGFIGTGNIAHTHVKRLALAAEAEIVALADPSEKSRQFLKQKFGLEQAVEYADHLEMLQQSDLDAVVICSPHTLHFQQSSEAFAAGKHVLIEKPMTCSSAEARELIQIAQRAGKLLQVSFQRHYMPQFMYIQAAISEGVIGKLTSVTATLYQDWRDAQKGTWRQNALLSGGGMLMDSGSHIIDVLLWTTGLEPQSIVSQLEHHGAPVEVDTFTAIRFAGGAVGSLNIVGLAPTKYFGETYAFIGDKGGIFYDNGKILLRRNG
jgi:predicted dehydrogenase